MSFVENIITRILQKAKIVQKAKISDHAFHIRLQNEKIKTAEYIPGYFLRIWVGFGKADLALKEKIRSYSVWNIDKQNGTIDLAVATHSEGPGTDWAKECKVGDTVHFAWHKGKFLADDSTDSYLLIGDISTLGHLYEINRNLSKGKNIQSIVYGNSKVDFFVDLDGTTPLGFYEISENPSEAIIEKLALILSEMNGTKTVYIGGDSRVCLRLTHYFTKELQWNVKQLKVKPFWNPEKRGLE